jgi:hypothetical protein
MKCALELVAIAKEAERQRAVEELRRQEEERRIAEKARKRTIEWCETVLSNYLEQYARKNLSFSEGAWTHEYGKGHMMHFSGEKRLYPLREESIRYANGDYSYTVASAEYLDLETIVKYCLCISGGIVPSKIPSTNPPILVIGVLSSCDTFAIKLFLELSSPSRDFAILFIAAASSPNSSLSVILSFSEKSPLPKRSAAFIISLTGFIISLVTK